VREDKHLSLKNPAFLRDFGLYGILLDNVLVGEAGILNLPYFFALKGD
jgi:hypothetical protein